MLKSSLGWPMAACVVMAAPAVMINLVSGQNGAFSAAILAGGLMLLDRRPVLAGLLLGLLCYKPQLAVLVQVALVASGRWRTAFAAGSRPRAGHRAKGRAMRPKGCHRRRNALEAALVCRRPRGRFWNI
jgi:hypothetical protein